MWNLVLDIVEMCNHCKSADDVQRIWNAMRDISEEAFFLLYDRVCALEDLYNDGRWV